MDIRSLCRDSVEAKYIMATLDEEKKNEVLRLAADKLMNSAESIISVNDEDIANALNRGMNKVMVDRLKLDKKRINAMAEGLIQVSELNDPLGEIMDTFTRPNGLKIEKIRVPMGVIGIIYESRPNVTADAFALCFKTGNAVILKGGSDAINSNRQIVNIIKEALRECMVDDRVLGFIDSTDREDTKKFMEMKDYVDVLIPRGGAGLINAVVTGSQIPVIETGTGNCHIYVDKEADMNKALPIIVNAKTQRVSVCNAAESLVVHKDIMETFLPRFATLMYENNVEIRADREAMKYINDVSEATEEDYAREYLDYIISVKTVSNVDEAIAHINRYHTGHSDCIVTENSETAEKFLREIDSACVYHNASTRFTDGFEFGFGAEIGISTQKLHARGPMGLKELTSYKYIVKGNGQIRG
ncbi:MAG: glutamate-5-semialdehyde dehydrogenase [Lachnospiraceae bacterium]|nr:glutamate-5-semialdehyde dehydrogenase [Lachnospiraceae bacterium]